MATACRFDGDIAGTNQISGVWVGDTDGKLIVRYKKGANAWVERVYDATAVGLDETVPIQGPSGEPLISVNKTGSTYSFVLRGWRLTAGSLPARADGTQSGAWESSGTASTRLFGTGTAPASPVAGTLTNPSRIPSGTITTAEVIEEFHATLDQFEAWGRDLEAYAADSASIPTKGRAYLSFAAQALRNIFEGATVDAAGVNVTMTNPIRVACARAARGGAVDVASAYQFANSLYPSAVPTPTAVAGWWGLNGRPTALNAMVTYGATISGFRLADRSYLTSSKIGQKNLGP